MTLTSPASSAETRATDWRSIVDRVGLAGRALLYAVFGLLAIDIARGNSGEASTQGAVERIAGDGYGRVLLVALCIGLLALVARTITQALAGDPVEGSEATDRAEFAAKSLVYAGAFIASVSVLAANWASSSASSGGSQSGGAKQEATAIVLEWPGGQLLVIAGGAGIIAFGLYEMWAHTFGAQFMQRLAAGSMPDGAERPVEIAGRTGYGAKGLTTVIVGGFLVIAGWQHEPGETTGLSGALSELGDTTWAGPLLWAIAAGLIGYAAFSAAEATYRRSS